MSDLTACLYTELQTALVSKAEERRRREAKILGVAPETISLQVGNESMEQQADSDFKTTESQIKTFPLASSTYQTSGLASEVAMKACTESIIQNFKSAEENFGDSDCSESSEDT